MEEKIEDLEYSIDDLDAVINRLKQYKQFEKEANDLEIYKSSLECDLDKLKVRYEELQEERQKEAQIENREQERLYWKEAI